MTNSSLDLDLMMRLVGAHAVSGYEEEMIRLMADEMNNFADEVRIDRMGSVIAIRRSSVPTARRIMFFAHMDEVGFMVRRRMADGTLRLLSVSGNPRALPGQEVIIRTPEGLRVRGIVGIKSAHLTSATEAQNAIPPERLIVHPVCDGDSVPEIGIGSTVGFSAPVRRLPQNLICTGSLDDRAGCYVLIEVLRRLKSKQLPCTIAFVGTVQEEISCDGSLSPAVDFGADLAIAIDGTVCHDTPDAGDEGEVRLGSGPVVLRLLKTPGLNGWTPNPRLASLIENLAQDHGIPIQRDAALGLMSDAKPLRLGGIPSAVIGIPMRGKHSPVEIISEEDLMHTVAVVEKLALLRNEDWDIRRG